WAGRVTLCGEPDDLPTYDKAFAAYFGTDVTVGRPRPAASPPQRQTYLFGAEADTGGADSGEEERATTASTTELLRHRDVTQLTNAEREELRRLLALLVPMTP